MAQPGGFPPNPYPTYTYTYAQYMWGYLAHIRSLDATIGRKQHQILSSQFEQGIAIADQCEKQQRGFTEIQDLQNLLVQTRDHYVSRKNLHWSEKGPRKQEFDSQLDQIAQTLDAILVRLGMLVGRQIQPIILRIQQARMEDDANIESFIKTMDKESARLGNFESAYRQHDTASMNAMTEGVLQTQGTILAQDNELREEAARHATELTRWIMEITKQKFKPGLILGRRLVGEPNYLLTTQRNVIYTAQFVSGETVVLKMPHDRMQGEDPKSIVSRFQREVHLWHSLRYDHILPFYGVGMKQDPGRNRIYGLSPYLPNRDVVSYRQNHAFSLADALQLAYDIGLALRYLHERDTPIVHFNVCSQNVLVDDAGRGVLGGFGFSKELSASEGQSTAYATGPSGDLTRFRAPEYYNDRDFPLTTSADVWGWAMTTLELVSGEAPFREIADDFRAISAMTRGERPDRNSYPGIQQLADPEALWGLLEECWAHQSTKRPAMGEVVIRIKGLKDQQNELGRRNPPVVQPRRGDEPGVELVDGRLNQNTEQGRAPAQGRRGE